MPDIPGLDEPMNEEEWLIETQLLGLNVTNGRMGWWYRFWWRVLLGATFKRERIRRD